MYGKRYCTTPGIRVGIYCGICVWGCLDISKMLKFYVKIFYVKGTALSCKLSFTWTGLVYLSVLIIWMSVFLVLDWKPDLVASQPWIRPWSHQRTAVLSGLSSHFPIYFTLPAWTGPRSPSCLHQETPQKAGAFPGPGYSKLTTSLVNVSLNFQE